VKYLLDTQVYLWYLADSRKLTAGARSRIAEAEQVFVSAATIWEAAIKVSIGRFEADMERLLAGIEASGFLALPVTGRHAARVATLPQSGGAGGPQGSRSEVRRRSYCPGVLCGSDSAWIATTAT